MSVKDISWALNYEDLPERPEVAACSRFKMVLIELAGHASLTNPFPPVGDVASRAGMSRRLVRKVARALYEHGVADVMRTRGICGDRFLAGWKEAIHNETPVSRSHAAPRKLRPSEIVYVIGCSDYPSVKIGRTTNIEQRLRALRTMSPVAIEVLWSTPGGVELEKFIHRAFARFRTHGEWFDFGYEDPLRLIKAELVDRSATAEVRQ